MKKIFSFFKSSRLYAFVTPLFSSLFLLACSVEEKCRGTFGSERDDCFQRAVDERNFKIFLWIVGTIVAFVAVVGIVDFFKRCFKSE